MRETRPTLVTAALLCGSFLAALDVNVVGTSLPTIISQLGGLSLYGWVFSAYLLTATTTVPLYGRLADLHGRKPLYLLASTLFMLGSALCGVSGSMLQLILFRALQGLGAGGLIPITLTLFGDMYQAEARALVQGIFSVVWGVSSVLGPLIGGALVTFVSWRWVFWINLPIGIGAMLLLSFSLREELGPREARGSSSLGSSLLLIAAMTLLLLGFQRLGDQGPDAAVLGLMAGALLCGGGLVASERRASAPMFPPDIFRERAALLTYLSGLFVGSILFCLGAFIPLYMQGVRHATPTRAGMALIPMTFTWTATTFFIGRLARRLGYRPLVVAGGAFLLGGSALLLVLETTHGELLIHLGMAAIGFGMALTITTTTIAVQDLMPWNRRGLATAMMQFSRTIGGTLSVTLLSLLVTRIFVGALGTSLLPGLRHPGELLDPKRWNSLSPHILDQARTALDEGLGQAFTVLVILSFLSLLTFIFFPGLHLKSKQDPART